jgi:hypothetical protein
MDSLRSAVLAVADEIREDATITLRQLYYALTVRGVLPKTEAAYKRLAQITSAMRRAGDLPYSWIEDGTRITYAPTTYESAKAALEDLAGRYLESPWADAEVAPEIWLEKDALAGVVYDVTYEYCVPLRVQRGYASLSALYKAAIDIGTRTKRDIATQVYYLRDLDPSGADAARAAEATVREILGTNAAELPPFDAIEPRRLRALVKAAIAEHLPESAKRAHDAQVESARSYLQALAEATAS